MQLLYLFKLDKTGHVTYAYITLSTRCIYLKKKRKIRKSMLVLVEKQQYYSTLAYNATKQHPKIFKWNGRFEENKTGNLSPLLGINLKNVL